MNQYCDGCYRILVGFDFITGRCPHCGKEIPSYKIPAEYKEEENHEEPER